MEQNAFHLVYMFVAIAGIFIFPILFGLVAVIMDRGEPATARQAQAAPADAQPTPGG